MELELDDAVYNLYDFNESQRDLVRDCCEITIPFFYKSIYSSGAMPAVENENVFWVSQYAKIFCLKWNAYLGIDSEMHAVAYVGAHKNMLALEFFVSHRKEEWRLAYHKIKWESLLDKVGESLSVPMESSRILVEGLVYHLSESGILILKRNEKRFWTRSLAREDADSTLFKRMLPV